MEHGAYESAGPGGTLHWKERADRHWVARGMGGSFDVAPHGDGYHTYWMPDAGGFLDLGHFSTLGKAWGAARDYADGTFVPRVAAEGAAKAAEDGGGCAHTHPPEVPSAPCDTPPAEGGPVVVEKTEVAASKTVLVAGEGSEMQWSEHRGPKGGHFYTTRGLWGEYSIGPTSGQWGVVHVTDPNNPRSRIRHIGHYKTITLAKKAASADWAERFGRRERSLKRSPPKAKRARSKK